MQTRPIVYNETMLSDEYKRFFEVGLGYWLSNGGNPNPGYNYFVYGNWIGGSLDPTAMPYLANPRSKLTAMAQGKYIVDKFHFGIKRWLRPKAVIITKPFVQIRMHPNVQIEKKVFIYHAHARSKISSFL